MKKDCLEVTHASKEPKKWCAGDALPTLWQSRDDNRTEATVK